MSKKLLSLFAIATLTSISAYAEEVEAAPVVLEEQAGELLAANEVVLEEQKEEDLAGCGCGNPKYKKRRRANRDNAVEESDTDEVIAQAEKLFLAENTEDTEEELLVTEEKLASCCPAKKVVEEEVVEEEKLASCCPAKKVVEEEVVEEEAKLV